MRFFRPDSYYQSVLDIDPAALVDRGVEGVLLDLDNTILPRTVHEVPANLEAWVHSLEDAGLKVCFLSNDWHDRVVKAAASLSIPFVGKAVKPLVHGFIIARKNIGTTRHNTIMVGDQTFTDILGAHLCGMEALLVKPLATQDLWHTKLLRKLDKFFLAGMEPIGDEPAFVAHSDDEALV